MRKTDYNGETTKRNDSNGSCSCSPGEENKMNVPKGRWGRLALGTILLLFAGIIYAWSILKAPMAKEFGWTAAQLAVNYTITICFFCLGGLVSGLTSKKLSPSVRLFVGAVLVCSGFVLVSHLDGSSMARLYLAYGVMAGAGIGITYNTVISCTTAWFPDRKGISSASLMLGFGFSSLILGNIAGKLINTPDFGWRKTFVLLGIAIGIILLIGALLIRQPPAGTIFPEPKKQKGKSAVISQDFTTTEMLSRSSFWRLFIFFILLASVGSTVLSFAKDFSLSLGAGEAFSISFVGVISIFNGLGRLLAGTLFDVFGLRKAQLSASALVIVASLISLGGILTGSLVLGTIGLCLCGASYGFSATASPTFCMAFYGQKNYPSNFSVITLHLIPASFTASLAGSLVTSTGTYVATFLILIIFSVVGLGINLSIRKA